MAKEKANTKTSNSKVMSPMPKAKTTKPSWSPKGSTGVNPKAQGETVTGGPKR